jgi:hypothetical protein
VFWITFAAMDANEPIPRPLADAFAQVDRERDAVINQAKLASAA